ncbi:MAG: hypothetical protein LUI13_10550 [Lachnospiraceae bacterium]|nr:hypothetical protein [Lachnospiraceae bacterium]
MDSTQRKGIHFDLDTASLQQYYPGGDWHNAYYDVRMFFEEHGFEHIQGSGYHSIKAMSESKAMAIIYQMTKTFPWLNYCVSVCTIADVPVMYDITHVFEKEASRLDNCKQQ